MVIGLHHAAAVTHVGDSSEVGQREHMVWSFLNDPACAIINLQWVVRIPLWSLFLLSVQEWQRWPTLHL
jgi:hypothetical protein